MTQESSAKDEPTNCVDSWENSVLRKEGHEAYKDFKRDQDTGRVSPSGHTPQTDTKRQGRGFNQTQVSETKSSGPEGSPEGIAGDKTRVPKAGQKVQWQGDSGVIKGEAVEVLFEKKTINGEEVEAAKEEPKVVVKDSESGKVYVKSPDEVHF
ncbi:hypothetical protein GQ43DRAFT_473679 [Delitschia confertaspora ATCC 74209]|uniref:Hypervirulence associated protein TUDOR domain-containing protein n=1 Tax=Delitschia confertaspora ATCC 74209 TaxID=1513339 RepID=A0A9P4JHA0_9PLEO|nr:hypothetical protein GQ43DRAFT_473679 [Delitschia confertaspora ATCC 74209]